jgi:hypothetical protein
MVANGRFQTWWPLEGSKLGGLWKVPSLVAFGRFQAWWPLEGSKLGGLWNVPCLIGFGRKRRKKKETSFSPPFIFHPTRFYLNIFSIDFRVFFYHGSRPLFRIFFFPLTYKL